MPPVIPNPANIHEFKSEPEFERWLAKNHATATEVWIKIHKKGSGRPTVTTAEAIDVALCWGWIDAIRKSFDETSFLQRYTPRQKRSIWSVINTEHVARLITAKRMQAPGHAQIEAAKADGRWQKAYAGSKTMVAPDDLMNAINANSKARAMYETLTSQNRYALSFRVGNIKTEAARAKRIAEFVAMLARGETFYPNGSVAPRSAAKGAAKGSAKGAAKGAAKSTVTPKKMLAKTSVAKTATAVKNPAERTSKKVARKPATKKTTAKKPVT